MGWASLRRPPSAIFPLSPHMMGDNTDPTRAFRWSLGEGAFRQKGGIKRFEGWGGVRYGCDRNGFFINASCRQIRTILKQKKPKAKIAQCSRTGKFCPRATASPELPRGNTYAADSCAIGGGGGGRGNQQNWQGSAPPSPKIVFLFLGFVFESTEAPLKKRKSSETARPQFRFWIKIRVNPI
jgi:hypothetical protein